jgi:hypothetical protein
MTRRRALIATLALTALAVAGLAAAQVGPASFRAKAAAADGSCQLNSAKGNIKHVI